MSIRLRLPYPPHANNLFFTTKRGCRVKSSRYTKWLTEAGWAAVSQLGKQGHSWREWAQVSIAIVLGLPDRRLRDIDGAIKPLLDLLVQQGIVADDSWHHVRAIEVKIAEDVGASFVGAEIVVTPMP